MKESLNHGIHREYIHTLKYMNILIESAGTRRSKSHQKERMNRVRGQSAPLDNMTTRIGQSIGQLGTEHGWLQTVSPVRSIIPLQTCRTPRTWTSSFLGPFVLACGL